MIGPEQTFSLKITEIFLRILRIYTRDWEKLVYIDQGNILKSVIDLFEEQFEGQLLIYINTNSISISVSEDMH